MGLIAKILDALGAVKTAGGAWSRKLRADPGGGAALTVSLFGPAGDDSAPLASDTVVLLPVQRTGSAVAVGVVDTRNQPTAGAGERRLYSRNAAGAIRSVVWLKSNGSILLTAQPSGGSIELRADGAVEINGVIIGLDGSISAPGSIQGEGVLDTSNNVGLGSHNHGGDPPVPGT